MLHLYICFESVVYYLHLVVGLKWEILTLQESEYPNGENRNQFGRQRFGENFNFDYKQNTFIKQSSLQYIAEKPVASTRMVEVKYDFEAKDVNPDNIKGLRKASVINRSYFPQCATRSYEFSIAESSSFSFRTGQKYYPEN